MKPNPNPIEIFSALHEAGRGFSQESGDAYVEEVYKGRKEWRGE